MSDLSFPFSHLVTILLIFIYVYYIPFFVTGPLSPVIILLLIMGIR